MYNNASCIITIFTINGNKTKPKDKKSKCINSTIVFLNHSNNNFYDKRKAELLIKVQTSSVFDLVENA